jgi:NAD(P)-dependent dehydrogenase (short-subunit alcohol dehydrogenase family)
MSKVWLVTGSGSGLGRNIAEAVLASGDRLIATARDPRRSCPVTALSESLGKLAQPEQEGTKGNYEGRGYKTGA